MALRLNYTHAKLLLNNFIKAINFHGLKRIDAFKRIKNTNILVHVKASK
jgi:hypothetical protein